MLDKNLHYFVTVCECKSIAQAAEKLYISRQALSLTLKRFEEEIGVALFVRNVRGITLTEEGEFLYHRCKSILAQYEEALMQIRHSKKDHKTTLRVAFSLIAMKVLTTSAIMAFEEQHANVSLSFSSMVSWDAWKALANKQLDFVCTVRPPEEYGFRSRMVKRGQAHLLVSSQSALARKKHIALEDLKGQILLNSTELKHFSKQCEKAGVDLKYRYFTNDPALISEAVANDRGVYAVPKNTLSVFHMDGITAIPFEPDTLDLNLYLTCRDPQELPPGAREFADYLCRLGERVE